MYQEALSFHPEAMNSTEQQQKQVFQIVKRSPEEFTNYCGQSNQQQQHQQQQQQQNYDNNQNTNQHYDTDAQIWDI